MLTVGMKVLFAIGFICHLFQVPLNVATPLFGHNQHNFLFICRRHFGDDFRSSNFKVPLTYYSKISI